MTENELHRLSRKDLLEMMIEQGRQIETLKKEAEEEKAALKKEAEAAKEALKNREIKLNEAGSIAVAALQINGVFEAAQAASQQYVENVRKLNDRQKEICAQMEAESREKADKLLADTENKCRNMEEETHLQCEKEIADCREECGRMKAEAKQKSDEYWQEVSARLQSFYDTHQELKKLLTFDTHI